MISRLWYSSVILLFTILFVFPIIVVGLFDVRKECTGKLTKYWAKLILIFTFVDYGSNFNNQFKNDRNYILVSNHQSFLDILVIFALFDMPVAFFTKKELFYIPIFGWALKLAGMVYVDRQNKDKSKTSVDDGIKKLEKTSLSILVFPEGTRTEYSSLSKFKKGAFILGVKSKVPIIPITLIYNKKPQIDTFNIKVRLFVDNPINTLNYNIEQKDFLLVKVKETINKNLKKLNIEDEN